MERFKEKIQAALDANLTVASWYPSDDFSQYTIVLSNGDELRLQASGQSTPFYQFKIEDGVWKYSSDKGAGWYNVKTQGTEQDIPGTDKDIFFYDYETGFIFINKSESEATKTNISITLVALYDCEKLPLTLKEINMPRAVKHILIFKFDRTF